MRFWTVAAVAAVAALGVLATPADAQTNKKKRVVATRSIGYTVFTNRDESGRTRTRIIVQRRSYLDPGNQVLPGEYKYRDYVMMPGYSVTGVIDNTAFSHRSPLPGPFDLPGRNNPMQW
jgi:hypothetical protein